MSTSIESVRHDLPRTKRIARYNPLKNVTLGQAGGIMAAIGLAVITRASCIQEKHQAEMHEHRDSDREMMLYATAPARQALRAIMARSTNPQAVEGLIQANIDLNSCLQEYSAHVHELVANCRSYDLFIQRFATLDEDDNIVFNESSGLTGATPGLMVNTRPLMNIDISRGPYRYELSERDSNLTILPYKIAQALRRHRAELETCRARIVLVDRSLADLQRERRRR
jgi:hypothetical protein